MTAPSRLDPKSYMHVLRRAYGIHYREHSDVWTADPAMRSAPALALARLAFPARARALDVGCGAGRDVEYLADRFQTVVGIDIVAHPAWDRIVQERQPAVTFMATDLLSYRPAGRYDLVMDNGCFHHQHEEDHAAYLGKAAGLLAPGGWFVLSTFKNPALEEYVDANGRVHLYFGDDQLHAKLSAAGLEVVHEAEIHRPPREDHYRLSFCRARRGGPHRQS